MGVNEYENAWTDLKAWLDDQQDYIMIPVKMIKNRMSEEEDLYPPGSKGTLKSEESAARLLPPPEIIFRVPENE